jgi:hypothetical protein
MRHAVRSNVTAAITVCVPPPSRRLRLLFVRVPVAAHLLRVVDPATGQPLEANKLKAEVAAFMAAGERSGG